MNISKLNISVIAALAAIPSILIAGINWGEFSKRVDQVEKRQDAQKLRLDKQDEIERDNSAILHRLEGKVDVLLSR